ncbi:MAG: hypothetical protein FWH08_04765 [Oscillospiraceae bacterium]|nr:hypothetical protein [Oscillospiraceae bacterium]
MSDANQKHPVKKTTITLRIIWILLSLFFIITVVSQVYIYWYNPLQTEVAMIYTTSDAITFKGVLVRNEMLVRYTGADVISYIHPDGSKLGRNSVVAQSYKSREDILLQRRIDELSERVRILESAEALANTDNSQLESYINQITNRHIQLLQQVNSGDYSSVAKLKNDYLSLQCKKRILRNDETDYRGLINSLENEITSLSARMSSQPQNVTIEEAGYFVSVVDGYETELNYDTLPYLNKEDIERIIREPMLETGYGVIGKMIDDYKWRFVGVLDTDRTRSLYVGRVVDFRMGGGSQIVQATVVSVKRLDDGSSIIIFECDTLTAEFASRRVSQFSLLLDSYKGIRIPTSAVHFNEQGERGVFVRNGPELVFRRIKDIRVEKDYLLVEDTTEIPGFISLYDNIVVKGRDLYEGKIVQ